jgi:hypothetical protein
LENNKNGKSTTQSKLFARAFWITIGLMFSITTLLYLSIELDDQASVSNSSGNSQTPRSAATRVEYSIQSPGLRRIFGDSARKTVSKVKESGLIDVSIDRAYAPVYTAIDGYLDHHYSVWGSYAELAVAVQGGLADAIESKLFQGHDGRMAIVLSDIDVAFNSEFQKSVDQGVAQELPPGVSRNDLSSFTRALIDDTKGRAILTSPVSGAASIGGALAAKVVAQKIGAQVVAALAVKTGVKGATKAGATLLGGALTGAAGGSVVGPVGTVIGGIGGAIATWLAVDKVFVEVDEYRNRDSFKAELVAMIDASKEETKVQLRAMVENRGSEIEAFTMRSLNER